MIINCHLFPKFIIFNIFKCPILLIKPSDTIFIIIGN